MKNTIIGVDPSSRKLAAVVLMPDEMFTTSVVPLKTGEIEDRCLIAYNWMRRLVMKNSPCVVIIEDPLIGRGGARAVIPQTRINGALLTSAKRAGAAQIIKANVSSWKREVIGKGNANKPQVAAGIMKVWPVLYDHADGDQDLLDAAGILLYGRKVLRRRTSIMKKLVKR